MTLADRMKQYEAVTNIFLTPKSCIAIRLDGHNFKSFTAGFNKPFDNVIIEAKKHTLEKLCKNTQNCIFGYEQSDEILLLLNTYSINSEPLLGNRLEKIVSLKAAEATVYFNESLSNNIATPKNKLNKAYFDCRAFNIPEHDAANLILWRIQDCKRNSIQMVAQSLYSHKQLIGKNSDQLKDLIKDKGQDWDLIDDNLKFGFYYARKLEEEKKYWICNNMPDPKSINFYDIFTNIVKTGFIE